MNYIKTLAGFIALNLIAGLMSGCFDGNPGEQPIDNGQKDGLTINFAVPGMATLTRGSENDIDAVDVIVFDSSGGFTGNYTATEINRNAAQTTFQYYITGLELTGDFEVVAIANSSDVVAEALEKAEEEGGETFTKEQFVKHLVITLPEPLLPYWDNVWGDCTFPMYGETKWVGAFSQATQAVSVELVRAVSDVLVYTLDSGYYMEQLYLFNFSTNGMLRPNYDEPLKPNLPSDLSKYYNYTKDEGYFLMEGTKFYTSGSLYVFETPATDDSTQSTYVDDSCYIVVSLYYQGTLNYYRIDMTWDGSIAGTRRGEKMPILRNYRYYVSINQVLGPGYLSLEEARNHESELNNLNYTIHMEDQGRFEKIAYDGRYMLGVGKTSFDISADKHYSQIPVSSNHPDNWSAKSNNDWIKLSLVYDFERETTSGQSVTSGNATGLLGISVSKNDTGSARTGTINITSGKLTIVVTIRQSNQNEAASIEIIGYDNSGNTLYLLEWYDIVKKGIMIKWTPADAELKITKVILQTGELYGFVYGGEFVYGYDSDRIYEDTSLWGGAAIFNIYPAALNSGVSTYYIIRYNLNVVNNGVSIANKKLDLMHWNYGNSR